jgi:ornithine cyclodeaminase/alanine dehydrogenase-like protein (mu-crystallin family)
LQGRFLASLAQADDSQVAILATDSRTPFFHPEMSTARLVISLGADSDVQSELDPEWIDHATLITDLKDSALIGDLKRWHDDHLLQGTPPFDLVSLLRLPTFPASEHERIVFISTGSALLDNLTIHYLLEKAGHQPWPSVMLKEI